jgi:uncharacterized protein YgbK (DUF1537 family)
MIGSRTGQVRDWPVLAVVADDLTGAADCAAGLARGGSVPVVWSIAGGPVPPVLAVDTDSRWLPAAEAAARVAAVVAALPPSARLYKKIDSTLRGPVAAEVLSAVRTRAAALGPQVAVVAAAYPETGRTVVEGVVRIAGRILPGGDIGALFRGATTARIGLAEVERGSEHLVVLLAATAAEVVICDAVTPRHLAAVAAAADALPRRVVGVGSGGLARHLTAPPGSPPGSGASGPAPLTGPVSVQAPVVTIVGSLARLARTQADRLAALPGVAVVGPDPAAVSRALRAGRDVLVTAGSLGAHPLADPAVADRLAAAVARAAGPVGAVVATGGDTARAWLRHVGATALLVHDEMTPGIVRGTPDVPGAPPLVSKAGSFGRPDTLAEIRDTLRGEAR